MGMRTNGRSDQQAASAWADVPLLMAVLFLCAFGLLMMTSASLAVSQKIYGDATYLLDRRLIFMLLALVGACIAYATPFRLWLQYSRWLLFSAFVLLILVLIPGVGREVNGSYRWLDMGLFTVQASEVAKLCLILYVSDYVARHQGELRATFFGVFRPVLVTALVALLLLLEPDLGTAAIIGLTVMVTLYLATARLSYWLLFIGLQGGLLVLLAYVSPYRWDRVMTFMDPWKVRYESGYQLVESLSAVGSGSLFGVGLGESVQKFLHLPEAHTDFVFSIIAEELGLFGVLILVFTFCTLIWRCFVVARRAFDANMIGASCFVHGVALWLGIQAFVNMGVALALLPTKGVALPLISVGGTGLCVTIVALTLVQRVHCEAIAVEQGWRTQSPLSARTMRGAA